MVDQIEALLGDAPFLGGENPSAADREALETLGGKVPDVLSNPKAFAWYSLVGRFSPAK